MSDKPLPSFRQIASPLDVDDAALDSINQKLGVPTLTRPKSDAAKPKAPAIAEPARAPVEKLTIEIPAYLGDAIRRDAVGSRKTARHVVMEALKAAGYKIEDVDLVPDGRRSRKT